MPTVVTPALVLHVLPYGDTSKILKLLTRELGLVSAMARGARRARSRTGARLDLFTEGVATLFVRPQRDLHPLQAFEAAEHHGALAADVGRFAAASALAELVLRCVSPEPHPELFDTVSGGLGVLAHAPDDLAETAALLAAWSLVVALGFSPTLDGCVVCGAASGAAIHFSPSHGGAVCTLHRSGARVAHLAPADGAALADLIAGRMPAPLDQRHAAAHRRLLMGFIRYHLAEHRAMPALTFWDEAAWTATSS